MPRNSPRSKTDEWLPDTAAAAVSPHPIQRTGRALPGSKLFIQGIRLTNPVICNSIFAKVSRNPQHPGFFMRFILQLSPDPEILHQGILQNILSITGILQIGIGKVQDGIAPGIQQAFGLPVPVRAA